MLNEQMDSVVLVKGWKKAANWSFPRGKINKDEPDLDCAVREVYEETGYDIKAAGLVGNEKDTKYIEVTMREQHMRLYVFRGVPIDTHFEPRTRKEISKIEWYKLSDLPTIKKKKQQQEGRGEDLAVNANKFYMVAPFLVPLKKWISAQRKLDKAKQPVEVVEKATATEEEHLPGANHRAEERTIPYRSSEDLARLLDSLRQSAQPGKKGGLHDVPGLPVESKDITTQLKSVLGVPSAQPTNPGVAVAASDPASTSRTEQQRSNDLLALLRGNPAVQTQQIPQTPSEQVIGNPLPPASPPHPRHQPPPFSSLPPPPTFPFPSTHGDSATALSSELEPPQASISQTPQPPQVRSIPPPRQPAQLVPRVPSIRQKPVSVTASKQQILAPYRRTGDPQFMQYSQVPGNSISPVPSANKLPRPKLNAQSSALLDIFKSGRAETKPPQNGERSLGTSEVQTVPANLSATAAATLDTSQDLGGIANQPKEHESGENREPASTIAPPQNLSETPSSSGHQINRPKSEHHQMLLSLFRKPSMPAAEPVKSAANLLQPPPGPVELSALPMTPGRSKEPSRADPTPEDQISKVTRSGSVKAQKRPRKETLKGHNPPVSATVSGPLNVPQFDVLAKASKESKHATHNGGHKESPRRSPVTILARPSSSTTHPALNSLANAHAVTHSDPPPPKQQKAVSIPQIQTHISPVKAMPPTPDLKARPAPLKPFQPQILRRPTHNEDGNDPSPIQPLPSPRHKILANRTTQQADHKKSLLSLLTKPSPLVSPVPTAPASAIDPASVVSPLSERPTPREQAETAFAQITRDGGVPPQHQSSGFPPLASPSRSSSVKAVVAGGYKKPLTPRTTPVDRSFLLGYLEGVANSGR